MLGHDPRDGMISARRELHELADLVARTCRPVQVEQMLRVLHSGAIDTPPRRELAAIIELAVTPLRS